MKIGGGQDGSPDSYKDSKDIGSTKVRSEREQQPTRIEGLLQSNNRTLTR